MKKSVLFLIIMRDFVSKCPVTVGLCVVWDFETINFQFTTNFI